ncbi:MAG: diacylglycerol kinase family lipid kinase [Candidatus Hydrogenedentes bacterium]|nr:diacylglycerol kinase family lipid kinase [Candidatus Hydrogenedentota bacterium]
MNPKSANGRTGKAWPRLEPRIRAVLGEYSLLVTERPWHAADLARRALHEGHSRIVSVGGDGTHHEVLNGFFDGYLPINPEASLAIFPHGTGSDLARTLGVSREEDALAVLEQHVIRHVDIGRATFTLPGGSTDVRYFINVADFGLGGVVVANVNGSSKRLGPFLTFLLALLRSLVTFENPQVKLQIDGEHLEQKTVNVMVANGQYYGGGIHVAREAAMASGTFEVYVLGDVGFWKALWNVPRLYAGTYVDRTDLVRRFTASRVVAQSEERVLLNLDGEQPGLLPAVIEILPSALPLECAPGLKTD